MKIMNPKSDNYFPQTELNGGWHFLKEKVITEDTTASGGNANLLAL